MLPYAAGALDPAERDAVRAHLASACPRCAVELAEAEATVAQLPLGLDPMPPSAEARAKLMSRVGGAATKMTHVPTSSAAVPTAPPAPMRMTPTPPSAPPRRSWPSYAAAACVGALLAAVTVQYAYRGIYENRVARAESQIANLKAELANKDTTFTKMQQMIDSPDLRLVAFQPTEERREAKGRILWDRERNQWHISVFDMQPPAPGQAYELWFFGQDKKPVAGPVLKVDATGHGSMTVDVPRHLGPITLAAFTNEPEQGLPAPTGKIHLQTPIE
jgi:hypothetical protein